MSYRVYRPALQVEQIDLAALTLGEMAAFVAGDKIARRLCGAYYNEEHDELANAVLAGKCSDTQAAETALRSRVEFLLNSIREKTITQARLESRMQTEG